MSRYVTERVLEEVLNSEDFNNRIEEIVIERLADILKSQEGGKALVDKIQHAYEIGHLNFPPREK